MRGALKTIAERLLLAAGPATRRRRALAGHGLVLAYHNVVPTGAAPSGDLSLHLPFDAFRRQLDLLEAECDIVPLSDLLEAPVRATDRARIALTFDDAYRGAVFTALPELAVRGHPATLFVAPGCLGNGGFWWDRLRAPGAPGMTDALRALGLGEGRGVGSEIEALARRLGLGWEGVPDHACAATEAELAVAAAVPSLSLAAHSWNHPNLTALSPTELGHELTRPLAWLRERFPRVGAWLAYPYGLDSPAAELAVRSAGYSAAFRVSGGWLPVHAPPPMRLPRLNIPAGLTPEGFRLRLAGFFCG